MGLFGKRRPSVKRPIQPIQQQRPSTEPDVELFDKQEIPACDLEPLLQACSDQLRERGLHVPLLFLPFRPRSDLPATRAFIRQWYAYEWQGDELRKELLLCDVFVVAALLRWALMRVQGGLLDWSTYLLFRATEEKLKYEQSAFQEIVPALIIDPAKQQILLALLKLLAAEAAHAHLNGHPARKLARQSAAFFFGAALAPASEGKTTPFQNAYARWQMVAAASEHLFVSYLRSLTMLPKGLEKMLKECAYPLQPAQDHSLCLWTTLQSSKISANPRTLAQRVLLQLQSRRELAPVPEAMDLLTEESHRLLRGFELISSNHSEKVGQNATEIDWLDFQDFGFDAKFSADSRRNREEMAAPVPRLSPDVYHHPTSQVITGVSGSLPDWQQFMAVGVSDTLVYRQPLPRIDISADRKVRAEQSVEVTYGPVQQELASLNKGHIDAAFWGAWMNTMAGESSAPHRSIFGRSVVVALKQPDIILVVEELLQTPAVIEAAPEKQRKRLLTFKRDKQQLQQLSQLAPSNSLRKVMGNTPINTDADLVVAMRLKKLLDDRKQDQQLIDAGPSAKAQPKTPVTRDKDYHNANIDVDVKKMLNWAEDGTTFALTKPGVPDKAQGSVAETLKAADVGSSAVKRKPAEPMPQNAPDSTIFPASPPQADDTFVMGSYNRRPLVRSMQSLAFEPATSRGIARTQLQDASEQPELDEQSVSGIARGDVTESDPRQDYCHPRKAPSAPMSLPWTRSHPESRLSPSQSSMPGQFHSSGLPLPSIAPAVSPDLVHFAKTHSVTSEAAFDLPAAPVLSVEPKPRNFWLRKSNSQEIAMQPAMRSSALAPSYAEPPVVRRHSPAFQQAYGHQTVPTELQTSYSAHTDARFAGPHLGTAHDPGLSFGLDEPAMQWNSSFDPTGKRDSMAQDDSPTSQLTSPGASTLRDQDKVNRFNAIEEEAAALQRELEGPVEFIRPTFHERAPSATSSKYSDGGTDARLRVMMRTNHQAAMRKVLDGSEIQPAVPVPQNPATHAARSSTQTQIPQIRPAWAAPTARGMHVQQPRATIKTTIEAFPPAPSPGSEKRASDTKKERERLGVVMLDGRAFI